jgi:hypothetical protein
MLSTAILFFACEKEIADDPGNPDGDFGTANTKVNVYDGYFLYGSNMAWKNHNWDDRDIADILVGNPSKNIDGVGVISLRPALYEFFVEYWGYDVRASTFQYYRDIGAKQNVVFIGDSPSEQHAERRQYAPGAQSQSYENLYEPIWDNGENGTPVNDNNYYALYVYKVALLYKGVKFWEIKNEPDLTYDWYCAGAEPSEPCSWWNVDPPPGDLINWFAPIQSYIRLLRVSYEVIKSVDPDAFICVGGIGYPSFLDAILRQTENPDKGKVTDQYPHKGGAWFDCLSYHCYPMYYLRRWNNNIGGFDLIRHSDAAAEALINQLKEHEDVLSKYGYGGEYPRKEVIVTETNIPSKQLGESIGSPEAQRNYLLKAAVLGQKNRICGIYPFCVWDDAEQSGSGGEYNYMGFYKPLPDAPGGVLRVNESGIAWRTISRMLKERKYDAAETARLALPPNIEGGAFRSSQSNDYVYALWAKTTRDLSETASAAYTFPSSVNANRLNITLWNGTSTTSNGSSVNLNGSPVFVQCL